MLYAADGFGLRSHASTSASFSPQTALAPLRWFGGRCFPPGLRPKGSLEEFTPLNIASIVFPNFFLAGYVVLYWHGCPEGPGIEVS